MASLREIFPDEYLATAMEYSLVAAWVALAIILGLALIGANLGAKLNIILGKFPCFA
jgi:Flp pilus assembly pilin Flp